MSNKSSTYSGSSAQQLIPVSRDEIISMTPLPADFYVKLSDEHFVMVGRRGAKQMEDLHALKNSEKVSDLYVRRDEYKDCVGMNLQIAEIAISKQELSDLRKVDILCKASDSVFQEISKIGFNHESLEHSKTVARSLIVLVSAKQDLSSVIEAMSSVSVELVRHSIAVSAVSIMIARSMHWNQASTNQRLALSALLHDIGLKEIPAELLNKPRHMMSIHEVKSYETHVMRAAEILASMPSVSNDVVSVALEHHENAIGQGYPRHLRDVRLHPFSKIVALADCFCDLSMKNVNNPNPRSAEDTVKYMELTLGQPFSKPAFQALKHTLSLDLRRKNLRKVG
ncbi:MAG: HD-GYP domain-containing protein [Pseudobdellovibrionaceae bacterium]